MIKCFIFSTMILYNIFSGLVGTKDMKKTKYFVHRAQWI